MKIIYILTILVCSRSSVNGQYKTASIVDGGALNFSYHGENNYFGNNVFKSESACTYNSTYNIVIDTEKVLPAGLLQTVYFYAFPYSNSIKFFIFNGNSLTASYQNQIWIKSASLNPEGSLYTVNVGSDLFYTQDGDRMGLWFESEYKCVPSTAKAGYTTLASNVNLTPYMLYTSTKTSFFILNKQFALAVKIKTRMASSTVGFTGPIGRIGFPGFPGSAGIPGDLGLMGSPGPPGFIGSSGAIGLAGLIGSRGSTGLLGGLGPMGSTGSTGFKGLKGQSGPMGIKGSLGAIGSIGFTGPTGFTGPKGNLGYQGETGSTGPQGFPGPVGQPGPAGFPGPPGNYGMPGDTGDIGSIGPTGSTGPFGATGHSIDSSVPSKYQGEQGADGFPGVIGDLGIPGLISPLYRILDDGSIGFCYLPQASGYDNLNYMKLRPICAGNFVNINIGC